MKKRNKDHIQARLAGAWFKVYSKDLSRSDLTKSEILVYSLIMSYLSTGLGFDKSSSWIAAYLYISERTVIRSINKLEELKYIYVVRTKYNRIITTVSDKERADYIASFLGGKDDFIKHI